VWNPPPPPAAPPAGIEPDPVIALVDEPVVEKTDTGTVIRIPEQPEFEVNTNILLPESRPIISDVADLINDTAELALVKIVGHASQEGDFEFNYRLAESRARAIYEALLEDGVAKQRLAYAGEGEVSPISGDFDYKGDDEEVLQPNRRVEFRVEKQFGVGDKIPGPCEEGAPVKDCYPTTQRLPWNGQEVDVVIPGGGDVEPDPDEGGDEFDDLDYDIEGGTPDEGGE